MILAILGTIISIISMIYSWINSGKKMENRLTVLESCQFAPEDRRCLHDLETKMHTIWKFFERDLPASLVQPHTPRLDELLIKAKDGLGKMSVDDAKELFALIEAEATHNLSLRKNRRQTLRGFKISLYRSFLEHELAALNILI